MSRKQCKKCPWKVSTNPHDIPNGYTAQAHCALKRTIAEPGALRAGALTMMACHEFPPGREKACVGWLVHQLGPGNNIGLRLRVMADPSLADVRTVGPQHERFEDTLPEDAS